MTTNIVPTNPRISRKEREEKIAYIKHILCEYFPWALPDDLTCEHFPVQHGSIRFLVSAKGNYLAGTCIDKHLQYCISLDDFNAIPCDVLRAFIFSQLCGISGRLQNE